MANLKETPTWEDGVYQLEEDDLVKGGADGIDNVQAKQLANRTAFLKALVESLASGTQPRARVLTALSGLSIAADKIIYSIGEDDFSTTDLTAFMRALLGNSNAAAARGSLGAAVSGANSDITSLSSLTTALSITQGGTGAKTAAAARAALGTAESGANGDITSLSGLTTALSIAQGGTGATTAVAARTALGAASPADIETAIAALVDSSPAALDTLKELSAALGNDADFAATINAALAAKLTQAQGDARYMLLAAMTAYAQLGVAQEWTKGQRGSEAALPATAGTITLDLAQSNNWGGVLTGNIVLENPSSMPVGQSGVIRLVNGAPPYTNAYGSYWKPVDGLTLPALTAVSAACDDLVYYVETSTRILVGRVGGSV